ncbi:hypothetical protein [Sinorhizobium fredii]|uniref:hypothetical protein n=1 Tax=Rhizobium fredii TaxID=380 RepID=UPI0035120D39
MTELDQRLIALEERIERLFREARLERNDHVWAYGTSEAKTDQALRDRVETELAQFRADIEELRRPRMVRKR